MPIKNNGNRSRVAHRLTATQSKFCWNELETSKSLFQQNLRRRAAPWSMVTRRQLEMNNPAVEDDRFNNDLWCLRSLGSSTSQLIPSEILSNFSAFELR
jgi:hypothetical protein